MYDIALSVNACIRSNTRADLAWLVSEQSFSDANVTDAIVFTPGGGKIGSVLGGAFDGHFSDVTSLKLSHGRVVPVTVGPLESALTNIPMGTELKFIVIPADALEEVLWPALLQRESIAIVSYIKDNEIERTEVFTTATILAADPEVVELFNKNKSAVADLGERIVTVYHPVTRLAIAGSGPIADAIEAGAKVLGWQTTVDPRSENFAGIAATLSEIDAVIILSLIHI